MNPKVSVILTTHGEGKYLSQAVASVLAQTYTDFELIIAADSCGAYNECLDDPRMDYYSYWNIPERTINRFAFTINQAFKESHGDFITYLCHDDLYLPYRLQVMVNVLEDLELDIVFGNQQLIDDTPNSKRCWWGPVRTGSTEIPMGNVDHSSVMHRRECFEKVGGWDEDSPMRYGDAFFWKRLIDAGYKFNGIDQVLDVHRFNSESVTWKEVHEKELAEVKA